MLSDIAPHAEVIGGTEAGILLPLEPEAWARALGALASDHGRLDRMAAAALALGQSFSIQRTATKMLALYQSLLP
jgi:glycosyltransferase involved in cell wall biosynthesis